MSDPITRLNAALEGRYRVERQLGEGGMATVYLAEDLKHERKVALKVLKPELAAVVGADRFLAEIKTTANLQHPHILPLHDSGNADGFLFFVMPYVEGETLRDRLDREKQLPVDEAVSIATNVAEALDYAHRRGVIHRDIKPANILLHAGKPLVADFGIALAARTAGGPRLTETGLSLGTPYYMSPEQAAGDQVVGPATDIYALGCVLYEMLVGEPPFTGGTAQAVLARILTGQATSVSELRRTVPPNVEGTVRRALERLSADRFKSADELRRALADRTFRYGMAHLKGSPGSPWAEGSRRWRTAAVAASVVAVASLAVALVSGGSGTDEADVGRPVRVTLAAARPGLPQPLLSPVAISADGSQVAFLGVEEGRVGLYHRSLGSPDVRLISGNAPLAGTDALAVAFSPDGRSLAFAATDGLVRRVSLDGGAPQSVAHTGTVPIGLTWSEPYGIVMGMFSFGGAGELSRAALGDTVVQRRAAPDSEDHMQHDPVALPGGEFAIYLQYGEGRDISLGVMALDDGQVETYALDPEPRGAYALVGVADGVLVYFDMTDRLFAVAWDDRRRMPIGRSVAVPEVPPGVALAAMAEDGTLAMVAGSTQAEVVIVNDRGETTASVAEAAFGWATPRFSPDGARLALAGELGRTQEGLRYLQPGAGPGYLGTYDLPEGPLSPLPIGIPLRMAAWTPNGRRVLVPIGFDRERRGRGPEIWSRAADASDQPTVQWRVPGQVWVVEPSPDGGSLALVVSTSEDPTTPAYDVVIRPLVGDTALVPFAAGPANEVAPRFSPDGRWLAYASNESGRYEVYARPFPGPGGRVQVSDAGGGQPVWSADGRRLFYRSESSLVATRIEPAAGSDRLRVVSRDRLFEADLLGDAGSYVATYDVHPDGERFAVARGLGAGNEVVLWLDWLDEVKALLQE